MIHRAGLVAAVPLTNHELGAIAFKENEPFFGAFESNPEPAKIPPERQAPRQVVHM